MSYTVPDDRSGDANIWTRLWSLTLRFASASCFLSSSQRGMIHNGVEDSAGKMLIHNLIHIIGPDKRNQT